MPNLLQVCENVRQDRCEVHHTEFCKVSVSAKPENENAKPVSLL